MEANEDILDEYLQGFALRKEDIMPGSEAISHTGWQRYRLCMKGKSTKTKLIMCRVWLKEHGNEGIYRIQIMNYINALKRGGQLSRDGQVQR